MANALSLRKVRVGKQPKLSKILPVHGSLTLVNFKPVILDGRYCYAKCLDGYYPPAGFSTKMTKITCKCPDAKGCEWQPQKPFIGCVGPCEQPLREFGSIKSFFKVKADYSLGKGF